MSMKIVNVYTEGEVDSETLTHTMLVHHEPPRDFHKDWEESLGKEKNTNMDDWGLEGVFKRMRHHWGWTMIVLDTESVRY
jgi:hypothetical protein